LPTVIFRAQVEVTQDNCNFRARQNQDGKDYKQDAKNVIHLVQPQGRQDKEELDKHGAKR
jgi:hypothetical protein